MKRIGTTTCGDYKLNVYPGGWHLVRDERPSFGGPLYAIVRWHQKAGGFSAPCHGNGDNLWYARGWGQSSINYVASWASRSTAYRRLKEQLEATY